MLKHDNLLYKRHIKRILKDFYAADERLVSATRLSGGKSNAAYHVVSSGNANGILIRSAHLNKTDLLNCEKNMMAYEKSTAEFLAANGIPVPKVLKYCAYGSVIKKEYAIYEFIKSDYPVKVKNSSNQIAEPAIDFDGLNAVIDKLHALKGESFGFMSLPRYSSWHGFIVSLGAELCGLAKKYKFFADEKYTDGLMEDIKNSADAFDEITQPFFVHNDIGLKNFLFKKIDGKYAFLCLIDLERCLFGDVDFEFSRAKLTDEFCYQNIMNGLKTNLTPSRIKRLRVYSLLNYLISMHIMKVKYFVPGYFKELKRRYIETYDKTDTYEW